MDDPVRDQRLTDLGFWSRVSDGVQWISRPVAAASVLSLLSKVISVPPSTWIETVLAAYRALFHPIVDGTIGLIPRVFGRVLLPATKDAIIVYPASKAMDNTSNPDIAPALRVCSPNISST